MTKPIPIPRADLYNYYIVQGLSGRQIAKIYKCDSSIIFDKLRKYNICVRTAGESAHILKDRKKDITFDTLYDLYAIKQLPISNIMKILKIAGDTLNNLLHEYGIEKRNNIIRTYKALPRPLKKRPYIVKGDIFHKTLVTRSNRREITSNFIPKNELHQLFVVKKLSIFKIAKKYNTTHTTIYRYLKKYNIARRSHFHPTIPYEILYDLYITQELNTTQIGKRYYCNDGTIIRLLNEYKIPLRTYHEISIKRFSNQYDRERLLQGMRQGLQIKPNKPETTVLTILQNIAPDEWKFVGDGQLYIGCKNPDFANVNGEKQLIEVYGDYWHRGQDPTERITHFKQYGYDTLVIWENELNRKKKLPTVVKRIKEFIKK
jgi:predicted DNA-binding protein YlxM (UPF0122 family)